MAAKTFSPEATREGFLPPWEVAKMVAYSHVIQDLAASWDMPPAELLGEAWNWDAQAKAES